MPLYDWKHESGKTASVWRSMEECDLPPDDEPGWTRVYSFGVGNVPGAGGSPSRPAPIKKD